MDISPLIHCALFAGLSEDEISTVLTCLEASTKRYPKGDYVYRAGESPASVGVVLEGSVSLVQEDYWGNRSLLSKVSEMELFGVAFACLDDSSLLLSVAVDDDANILHIDGRRIITVCSSACAFHQRLIKNMVTILAKGSIDLTRKIEHTNKRTIYDKLLSYLSTQAMLKGTSVFDIPFSRQELADYLAIDRASLSRALGCMKQEGLIKAEGRRFELIGGRPSS